MSQKNQSHSQRRGKIIKKIKQKIRLIGKIYIFDFRQKENKSFLIDELNIHDCRRKMTLQHIWRVIFRRQLNNFGFTSSRQKIMLPIRRNSPVFFFCKKYIRLQGIPSTRKLRVKSANAKL